MKHTLSILTALLAVAAAVSCTTPNGDDGSITISGHVKFTEPDFKVTVYQRSGSDKTTLAETVVDSAGNYTINLPIKTPGVFTVDCGRWQEVNVWGDDEDLKIDFRGLDTARIKIKNPPYVYIEGGKNNDLMNLLNFDSYRNYQSMIAISQSVYRNVKDPAASGVISMDLYGANDDDYYAHVLYLAEHFTDTPACLAAISQLRGSKYAADKATALAKMKQNFPDYAPIKEYIEKERQDSINRERMKIGNPAPLFSYAGQDGKKLGPADYKGKILVIDFWASWCGPCRGEIPNIKKDYEKYDGKGVEFLSVSVDAKKDEWEKALKEENMPWAQVYTGDAGKEIMELYQFSGIPFIVLVDADGNLAAKNLRGENIAAEIEKQLAK